MTRHLIVFRKTKIIQKYSYTISFWIIFKYTNKIYLFQNFTKYSYIQIQNL